MAELTEIREWDEARPYLDTLRHTVAGDIRPLLSTPGSAPFAIFRETMSYVDHLGHLYSGREPVGERFLSFMRGPLRTVYENYFVCAQELYLMYRNGPVHEFRPKVLENDNGDILGWLSYRGNRTSQHLPEMGVFATHLVPVKAPTARLHWLPVSLDCLIDDLESAIDRFVQDASTAERVTAWNRTARRTRPPQPFNFKL
jgi:hypothetical protein